MSTNLFLQNSERNALTGTVLCVSRCLEITESHTFLFEHKEHGAEAYNARSRQSFFWLEKTMGNASTQSKIVSETTRQLLALSEKQGNNRETLYMVPGQTETRESRKETLEITIPCKTAPGPDRVTPRYVVFERDGKVIACRWICPYCERKFRRRKPCCGHMGLIADRKHNCPVLRKQEIERRVKL